MIYDWSEFNVLFSYISWVFKFICLRCSIQSSWLITNLQDNWPSCGSSLRPFVSQQYSIHFQNRSYKFDFEASFPSSFSISEIRFRIIILIEIRFWTWFPNSYSNLNLNSFHSNLLSEFEFKASFLDSYLNKTLEKTLQTRISIKRNEASNSNLNKNSETKLWVRI